MVTAARTFSLRSLLAVCHLYGAFVVYRPHGVGFPTAMSTWTVLRFVLTGIRRTFATVDQKVFGIELTKLGMPRNQVLHHSTSWTSTSSRENVTSLHSTTRCTCTKHDSPKSLPKFRARAQNCNGGAKWRGETTWIEWSRSTFISL